MLGFLKNGSGIYIKPKNRGKFTKYCHGKVTSECIARGKRSSDPTVRKRATFAQNVRRWKHEEGGKAFIKGINVLDSNPTAYKYVKKKYKMAQEGTKLTFGQKVSNIGKNVGNWINNNQGIVNTAVNGITGLISANKKSKEADQFAKAKEAEMKSFKDKTWKEKYMENLQAQEDRSDVVNMSRAYNQTYGDVAQAVQEKQQKIDSQIAAAAQQKAAQAQGNAWGGILKGAGEIAMNALASNGIPKSKTSPTNLTGQKTSSFGGISTPQLTSPQTNYSFLK